MHKNRFMDPNYGTTGILVSLDYLDALVDTDINLGYATNFAGNDRADVFFPKI
jgi:hypothetical protein